MPWLLRTLPLALAVGFGVWAAASYLKVSRQLAAKEVQLAMLQSLPLQECASVATPAEEHDFRQKFAGVADHPAPAFVTRVSVYAPPVVRSPVIARPQAPAPAAPPLPFTYLGRMIDETGVQVFVAQGHDSHILRAGRKVGAYRVDKVTDSSVTFTHLPSRTRQDLDIPAVSE